jgi:predicted GIY-YIG superfamily endonuclease
MPYVYILECSDGTYYTGSTWDIEKRLAEHNNGEGANYTAKRLPVALVFQQEFQSIEDAFKLEKQLQGWSHQKKEALIKSNWEIVHKLAECRNDSNSRKRTK